MDERYKDIFERPLKIIEWKLLPRKIKQNRLCLLNQVIPFSAIIQRIADEMINIRFFPEDGTREAKGKIRADFSFDVSNNTLDLFFNSSQGLRAQYYISPERGEKANRFAIDKIKDKLIGVVSESQQNRMTLKQVIISIECMSAKIWIDEKYVKLKNSYLLEEIVELEVPRWVKSMEEYLERPENEQMNPQRQDLALSGVQAPEGKAMAVFGAWLDSKDLEFVVPSKKERSRHINQYGFS